MNTPERPVDVSKVQEALSRVAFSLDANLVNGILYGVLQRDVFRGFLENTAGNVFRDLAQLEHVAAQLPGPDRGQAVEALAALRARCQQLIDTVMGLRAYRDLPWDRVREVVSRIPDLRDACVQGIQELEAHFRTPKPFHASRPPEADAAVDAFLTSLESLFAEGWNATGPGRPVRS